jgi:hypothetical protein
LSGRSTAKTPTKRCSAWAHYANAHLDDDPDQPPRDDEFFHSESGGRLFLQRVPSVR